MPINSGSLHFGDRVFAGKISTVKNSITGSSFPPITNREFTEVNQYIVDNSQDGASIPVEQHLIALFQIEPRKSISESDPLFCTLNIITGAGYNADQFVQDVNTAVQFGYQVVDQDNPLKSWTIYYMSIGNNVYCITYSETFRRITVSSRV
jgi:hypothetical protein